MTHSTILCPSDSDNPYLALGEANPFVKVKVTDSMLFTAPMSQTLLFSSNYFTQRLNSEPVVMWSAQKSINSSMLMACSEVLLWTICLVSPFYCKLRLECLAAFKAQISLDLQFFCFFLFSTYSSASGIFTARLGLCRRNMTRVLVYVGVLIAIMAVTEARPKSGWLNRCYNTNKSILTVTVVDTTSESVDYSKNLVVAQLCWCWQTRWPL